MSNEQRNHLREKFMHIFNLVTKQERYQRPELDDRANKIIHAFQLAEPNYRRGLEEFRPIGHLEYHPALKRIVQAIEGPSSFG